MQNKKIGKRALLVLVSVMLLTSCSGDNGAKENYKKGLKLIEDKKYEEAVDCLSNAIVTDEKNELGKKELTINKKAYYALGVSYVKKNEYKKAEKNLKKALEIDYLKDWNYDIQSYYLDVLANLNNFEEAYHMVLLLREEKPKDYDLIMKEYFLLSALNKEDEAETLLNDALDIQGMGTQNNYNRAKIYYFLGNQKKAVEGMENALKKENPEAKFYMGRISEDAQEYEKAIKWYEEYEKDQTEKEDSLGINAFFYLRLGNCYEKLSKNKEAMDVYNRGISLSKGMYVQELKESQIVLLEKELLFKEALDKCEEYVKEYKDDENMKREFEFLKTRVKDKE